MKGEDNRSEKSDDCQFKKTSQRCREMLVNPPI